ncbi:uncharacterized protein PgNI_04409 [Pyricularia grisea]|uniref:Uncharacterized protein n=1 Tax=Pyricularia grisea TaxID=148305 RepID=A0A6P8BB49_PYRGI|nr:uncharacterized protein PgNI_04409 [Pyricularia grisea]TLD13055.1 hypothetical protein PgNI_04409 [Pyricularia grisea]
MQMPTLSAPVIIAFLSLASEVVAWEWCTVTVFYQGRTSGYPLPTAKKVGIVQSFPGEGKGYADYQYILDENCDWKEHGRPWLTGMRLETVPFVAKQKYE